MRAEVAPAHAISGFIRVWERSFMKAGGAPRQATPLCGSGIAREHRPKPIDRDGRAGTFECEAHIPTQHHIQSPVHPFGRKKLRWHRENAAVDRILELLKFFAVSNERSDVVERIVPVSPLRPSPLVSRGAPRHNPPAQDLEPPSEPRARSSGL